MLRNPHLLYGLEACIFTLKHIKQLDDYLRKLLKQICSFSDTTVMEAVYLDLLIGVLPVEARHAHQNPHPGRDCR